MIKTKDIPKANFSNAMKLLRLSLEDISNNTVQNCFTKARISTDDKLWTHDYLDDPHIELRSIIEELKKEFWRIFQLNLSWGI